MREGGDGFLQPASRTAALATSSKKHRCRVCGRSFPSGRSLGGHMRSHVYASPPSPPADCFDERQGSYSLRENPKKSRRFGADEGGGAAMQCVECGREFASWKALFGHMRCHTEKGRDERAERDGGSCASNGSDSDSGSRKRTFLWVGEDASASNCSLLTTVGEAEDGAIGLMLLSRGLRHWTAAAWGGEECSSDKNWEVLESSDLVPNATDKSGSEVGDSRIEFKKAESDDEIYGGGSGYHGSELEFRRSSFAVDNGGEKRSKFECKSCNKAFDSYQALGGHRASHKRIRGCHDAEAASPYEAPLLVAEPEAEAEAVRPVAAAKKKHQCSICNKLFSSGQALGGHKRSHLAAAASGSAPGPDAASSMVIPPAKHHEMPNFFDLNDPPSEDSEEVKSWWSGSELNHEMMAGAILN